MTDKIWNQFFDLATLPVVCLILSCVLALRHWKHLPGPIKWFSFFLFFNFAIEISARFCSIVFQQNLPLLHLYTLGEFLLFSLFYRQILASSSIFHQYFKWIVGVGSLLIVSNTVFLQGLFAFNSYAKTLVQVIIILYALDYAFRFGSHQDHDSISSKSIRLVNSAVLIYYSGSLFIFMASHFETEMPGAFKILWNINAVLNLIFQVLTLIALWKVTSSRRKSSSSQVRAS